MSRTTASLCVITVTMIMVVALFVAPLPEATILHAATVQSGSLEKSCMLTGRVTYADAQYLFAPIAGQVEQLCVKPGDSIEKDELLLSLDAQTEIAALSALNRQQTLFNNQLKNNPYATLIQLSGAAELLQWEGSRTELTKLIEAKQIRAATAGTMDAFFVKPGDYVTAGMPLGEMHGETLCINAVWTGDHPTTPKPGMLAWWCSNEGERLGQLTLSDVTIQETSSHAGLLLTFLPATGQSLPFRSGDEVPVHLVLDTLPASGLVPLDAVGSSSRLWVIRDDKATAVQVSFGQGNGDYVQVPQELCGLRVILNPQELSETFTIKHSEVP